MTPQEGWRKSSSSIFSYLRSVTCSPSSIQFHPKYPERERERENGQQYDIWTIVIFVVYESLTGADTVARPSCLNGPAAPGHLGPCPPPTNPLYPPPRPPLPLVFPLHCYPASSASPLRLRCGREFPLLRSQRQRRRWTDAYRWGWGGRGGLEKHLDGPRGGEDAELLHQE